MCDPKVVLAATVPAVVGVMIVAIHLLATRDDQRRLWSRMLWALYRQFTIRGATPTRTLQIATIGYALVTLFIIVRVAMWMSGGCATPSPGVGGTFSEGRH